jgi:hypothetical protein
MAQKQSSAPNDLPIEHWSYSSILLYLRNRLAWKKKYVLKIYDEKVGPSAVVGRAAHHAVACAYQGSPDPLAAGLEYIAQTSDSEINYGKTGSREKLIKTYKEATTFYLKEMPRYDEVLAVEQAYTHYIEPDGEHMEALPAKAVIDLIVRHNGEIGITDHKFVTTYYDENVDNWSLILQAMIDYWIVKAEFGEAPAWYLANQCKTSANKDGSPQLVPYVIRYDQNPRYFTFLEKLYRDVTDDLAGNHRFLPNLNDIFDGNDVTTAYVDGLLDAEGPGGIIE